MNGKTSKEDGVELYHEGNETSLLFPKLVQNDLGWKWKKKNQKNKRAKGIFIRTKNNLIHFMLLTPTSGELKGFRVYKHSSKLPQQIPNRR
jgi:hypothetical protein